VLDNNSQEYRIKNKPIDDRNMLIRSQKVRHKTKFEAVMMKLLV